MFTFYFLQECAESCMNTSIHGSYKHKTWYWKGKEKETQKEHSGGSKKLNFPFPHFSTFLFLLFEGHLLCDDLSKYSSSVQRQISSWNVYEKHQSEKRERELQITSAIRSWRRKKCRIQCQPVRLGRSDVECQAGESKIKIKEKKTVRHFEMGDK